MEKQSEFKGKDAASALKDVIVSLGKASEDSNIEFVISQLNNAGFKPEGGFEVTPLVNNVLAYIDSQKKLSVGAAWDTLPFAVQSLKKIYDAYAVGYSKRHIFLC